MFRYIDKYVYRPEGKDTLRQPAGSTTARGLDSGLPGLPTAMLAAASDPAHSLKTSGACRLHA